MRTSTATNEIAAALAKAQGAFHVAAKSSENTHFRTRYAGLAEFVSAAREALSANGLAVIQAPDQRRGSFVLVTRLTHTSGQWFESHYPLPAQGNPQQLGSAITYARRYALAAMLCLVADADDDGEAAKETLTQTSVIRPQQNVRPAADPEVIATRLKREIDKVPDLDLLTKWAQERKADLDGLPERERTAVRLHYRGRKEFFAGGVILNGAHPAEPTEAVT